MFPPDPSTSPPTIIIEEFRGISSFSEKLIGEAATLFSENYGVWGSMARENMMGGEFGTHVKITPRKLRSQLLPPLPNKLHKHIHVRLFWSPFSSSSPIGHLFATRWKYQGKNMLWITQLCVHRQYRNQGVAKRMLEALRIGESEKKRDEEEKARKRGEQVEAGEDIVGILSTHPFALMAVLSVFGNGIRGIDEDLSMMRKKGYVRELMESCPVEYVRDAKIRGALFNEGDGSTDLDGTVACADTQFWVDHMEPLEALKVLREKGIVWPFGELPDGCEFCFW